MLKTSEKIRCGLQEVEKWLGRRGHNPFPFQRKAWKAIASGKSGLLHSPTGTGKTLAVWLGALANYIDKSDSGGLQFVGNRSRQRQKCQAIQTIWITPLRALARDTCDALLEPVIDLNIPWSVERRSSDTSSTLKAKQTGRLPSCLITTPESLSVLMSYPAVQEQFQSLKLIVLDEWHELMGSKRGVMTELCLARLRRISNAKTWAISATIGNIEQALSTAMGQEFDKESSVIVRAPKKRPLALSSIVPHDTARVPWGGHMGLNSLANVVQSIEKSNSCLVFTNTRSQAERWYSAILHERRDWAGKIGIHHGSMDKKKREWVENELGAGRLKCVVCTSSLDLGVDFYPVEKVLQIGSPKGIARMLQRAGRSGHFPGGRSHLEFVPTHALELIELAAARDAVKEERIESRTPLRNCLDVLAQHVVTLTSGRKLSQSEMLEEARSTNAFQSLSDEEWNWVIEFVTQGGHSLQAYPEFRKVIKEGDTLRIFDSRTARRHRQSIGTIPSDRELEVKYLKGGRLGTIEERFISRLKPGECFLFGGKTLKLVMVRDMTAWVRRAKGRVLALPRWNGGRLPLSSELAESVRQKLDEARQGIFSGKEMKAVEQLLKLQANWSAIPERHSLLIEKTKTRDGFHLFFFPFEGRLVHEGLAAILAWRISRHKPMTFATTVNDYGIELLSQEEPPLQEALENGLFSSNKLENQIELSMNAGEMDRRQFRDIARIAGLVHGGLPGAGKSSRQLQASSDLFFDVFKEYDPRNLLLVQARREVMDHQLERDRLVDALDRMESCKICLTLPPKPTPLAFPILVDRLKMKLSSEKLVERIERLTKDFSNEFGRGASKR